MQWILLKGNIDNISFGCLELFNFLDLKALRNVADTCNCLQIAVAARFGDKYTTRQKGIILGILSNMFQNCEYFSRCQE